MYLLGFSKGFFYVTSPKKMMRNMKKAELTSAIAQSLESAIVIFTDVCYFAGEGQFSDSLVRFQANTQEPKLGLTKEMLQCCVTA